MGHAKWRSPPGRPVRPPSSGMGQSGPPAPDGWEPATGVEWRHGVWDMHLARMRSGGVPPSSSWSAVSASWSATEPPSPSPWAAHDTPTTPASPATSPWREQRQAPRSRPSGALCRPVADSQAHQRHSRCAWDGDIGFPSRAARSAAASPVSIAHLPPTSPPGHRRPSEGLSILASDPHATLQPLARPLRRGPTPQFRHDLPPTFAR